MITVNVGDAKTSLSRLIALAERGEDVVIARQGTPVVRLTPVKHRLPEFGFAAYPQTSDQTLFEPMSEEDLSLWEDGPVFPEEIR